MEPVSEDGGCNDIVNDYPQYLFYDSLQGTAVKTTPYAALPPVSGYVLSNPSLLYFGQRELELHEIAATHAEAEGIYRCNFSNGKEYSAQLLSEVKLIAKSFPNHPKIQLNMTGVDLFDFGFKPFAGALGKRLWERLGEKLFKDHFATGLCPVHMYIIKYSLNGSVSHLPHADDCDLTFNLCLGEEFDGGELYFADPLSGQTIQKLHHQVGAAVVHPGTHVHGALPITSGVRYNLIVWFNRMHPFPQFCKLPEDLQARVISFLRPRDAGHVIRSSKSLNRLFDSTSGMAIWNEIISKLHERVVKLHNSIHRLASTEPPAPPARVSNLSDVKEQITKMLANNLHLLLEKTSTGTQPHFDMILTELSTTEQTYLAYLTHIRGVIIPLYRQRGAKDDEIQAVFQNIDDLIALHTRLAEQFQLLGANPRSAFALFVFTFKISKILGNLSHHMKYMSGYENATKQYQKLSASYGDYHAPNGLDVPGHIIIPVRRIPRYVLLFKEAAKYAPGVGSYYWTHATWGLERASEQINFKLQRNTFMKNMADARLPELWLDALRRLKTCAPEQFVVLGITVKGKFKKFDNGVTCYLVGNVCVLMKNNKHKSFYAGVITTVSPGNDEVILIDSVGNNIHLVLGIATLPQRIQDSLARGLKYALPPECNKPFHKK